MYKKAIKENSKYLLPFIEGIKYFGSDEIEHALGTMIVLNKNGEVLTCKHIAERFVENDFLSKRYKSIINDSKTMSKEEIKKKYNIDDDSVVLSNISLPFEVPEKVDIQIKMHEYLDLALIRFKGINIECDSYPKFSKTMPMQGQSLCKLGYAFPEYDYFEYSKAKNNIVMKESITANFPLFPMDGIVTRLMGDEKGIISYFETSTPGIRGQSGGPVFSPEGVVYGMQSMTKHIDLNFDINSSVRRGATSKKVVYTPFINLGVEVSSPKIIEFLKENNVKFESVGEKNE